MAAKGQHLCAALEQLAVRHQIIGDVRGLGLFAGLEIVADRASREPFPEQAAPDPQDRAGARWSGACSSARRGGANYGRGGDHIHLSPPYIITPAEIDLVAGVLDETLTEIEASL